MNDTKSSKILLIFLLAAVFCLAFYKIVSVDFWIHLASGRELFQSRGLPRTNTFSYTFPNYPWGYVVGPFQLLLYLVFLAGSFKGIVIFKAFLLSLTFFVLWRIDAKKNPASLRFMILFLAAVVMRERFQVRPQLFFFLFSASYFLFLSLYQTGLRKKHLLALIPLQLLWVNIHGSFIIGIYLLGLFCLVNTLKILLDKKLPAAGFLIRDLKAPLLTPWLTLLALIVVSLINPQGINVFLHPFQISSQQVALITVAERQAIGMDRLLGPYGLLLTISILGFLSGIFHRQWFKSLTLLTFALMSLSAIRFIGIYCVAAAATLPALLSLSLPSSITNLLRKRIIYVMLLVISVITSGYIASTHLTTPFGWGVNQLTTPVGAVDFLEHKGIKGPLYNDIDLGDYLIWRLYPGERVFIDGRRFAAYPRDFYEKMEFLHSGGPAWTALQKKYNFNVALLGYSPVNLRELYPAQDWALVYWDDVAMVFLRRNQLNEKIIAENEFKNFLPNRFSDLKTGNAILLQAYEADLHRSRDLHPNSYRVNFALGYLYSWQGGKLVGLAEDYLKKTIKLCPAFAPAYSQLGLVYRNTSRPKDAVRVLKRGLRVAPDFRIAHFYLSTTYDILGDRKNAVKHMNLYQQIR